MLLRKQRFHKLLHRVCWNAHLILSHPYEKVVQTLASCSCWALVKTDVKTSVERILRARTGWRPVLRVVQKLCVVSVTPVPRCSIVLVHASGY